MTMLTVKAIVTPIPVQKYFEFVLGICGRKGNSFNSSAQWQTIIITCYVHFSNTALTFSTRVERTLILFHFSKLIILVFILLFFIIVFLLYDFNDDVVSKTDTTALTVKLQELSN
jgi:hypothetical protein